MSVFACVHLYHTPTHADAHTQEDEWIPHKSDRLRSPCPMPAPRATPQMKAMRDVDAFASIPPCGALAEEGSCLMPPELSLHHAADHADDADAHALGSVRSHQMCMPEHYQDQMPPLDLNHSLAEGVGDAGEEEDEEEAEDVYMDDELVIPTQIDIVKANLGGMEEGLVELVLNSSGRDLSFQWFEGNEAIPGACKPNLLLVNSGGVGGRIRCLVRNKYGASWIKCPVLLPAAPEEALQELDAMNAPGQYRLTCKCGHVREGLAQELCEKECVCGAVCCGSIDVCSPCMD